MIKLLLSVVLVGIVASANAADPGRTNLRQQRRVNQVRSLLKCRDIAYPDAKELCKKCRRCQPCIKNGFDDKSCNAKRKEKCEPIMEACMAEDKIPDVQVPDIRPRPETPEKPKEVPVPDIRAPVGDEKMPEEVPVPDIRPRPAMSAPEGRPAMSAPDEKPDKPGIFP